MQGIVSKMLVLEGTQDMLEAWDNMIDEFSPF